MKPKWRPARSHIRSHLRRAWAAYVVLLGALLLTGLAWYYVSKNVAAQKSLRFEETVASTQLAVDRNMRAYVDAMLDARGLFAASERVRRDEWRDYVAASNLARRYPGIRAIGYARRVGSEERDAHVSEVREQGFPNYNLRPSGERYEYFPIVYIEPSGGANNRLLGYDVYSDRVSRSAMEQARDTGLPKASGKVKLPAVDDDVLQPDLLIFTPVYRKGEPREDEVARRRALQGFIVGVFRTDELLGAIFGERVGPGVDLEIFDGAQFTQAHLLYDGDGVLRAADESHSPAFSEIITLEVAGRVWTLYFSMPPGFERGWQRNLPLLVLLSGLALSLLLFSVTWALTRSRAEAERTGAQLQVANRGLKTMNKDLEAANAELEAFSYSVSHDLRAPLRHIDGFSQILLEDHEQDLGEDGRNYLRRIRAATKRMGDLIDDLLGLSRLTRADMHWENVDLSTLARSVSADLRESDPKRDVEFVIQEGLVASGDARLLRVALENLIGNAWKFTKNQPTPRIEFGVAQREGVPAYYVRDNGAGFDMAYAGKLFGAFQRLHSSEEFEGAGIGLATVRRVVRHHGGQVWAEGKVGRGATFYFTLRAAEREHDR